MQDSYFDKKQLNDKIVLYLRVIFRARGSEVSSVVVSVTRY